MAITVRPSHERPVHAPSWGVLVATGLGFALVQMDVSIVNVALSTIGTTLGGHVDTLQWIVDSYTVAFAALLLSAGAFGDRFGARRVYLAGFVIFICASAGCGFASSSAVLIVGRIVQGAGAAIMVPCSLALLNRACDGDDDARARAVSSWVVAGSIALAAGPVIGGFLVQTAGWRTIFFVNVPLGMLGVALTLRALPETDRSGESIDVPGGLTAIVALATLTAAFIVAGRAGWFASSVLVLFAAAIVSAVLFVAIERRLRAPLLPLEFFGRAAFRVSTIAGFTLNATLYGTLFVTGLYLQRQRGYSALETGLAFLPFCVALGVANIAAGRLTIRYGPRVPMVTGLTIAAVGALALLTINRAGPYAALLPGLIVFPLGIGLAVPAITNALLGSVERGRSGVASGVLNTVRQAGGAIGVAVFGTMLSAHAATGPPLVFTVAAVLLALTAALAARGLRTRGTNA